MEVRRVAEDEVDAAGQVVVDAYAALEGMELSERYAALLRDTARRAREAEVLVAVDGGAVVGCVTYVDGPGSAWSENHRPGEAGIRMLGVVPGAQRRGVGRALMQACIERAQASGRRAIFLYSTPAMVGAHRLYEQLGFRRATSRDDVVPGLGLPLLAFHLPLERTGRLAGAR